MELHCAYILLVRQCVIFRWSSSLFLVLWRNSLYSYSAAVCLYSDKAAMYLYSFGAIVFEAEGDQELPDFQMCPSIILKSVDFFLPSESWDA